MRTSKQMIGWDVVVAAIVLVMLMAVWMGGCAGVSVDPVQIQNLAMQTEQLNGKIDQFQEQTKLALQSSKQNGTVDANALAKVEKLQTSIDSVQAKTQAIADAVKNAQYTNPADGVTTALEGARAANAASSPWHP